MIVNHRGGKERRRYAGGIDGATVHRRMKERKRDAESVIGCDFWKIDCVVFIKSLKI